MPKLVIKHNLHELSKEELTQYLRDVSEYVGIDPDLNAFDTIWMPNETGPGQSLIVYARRGTAEILRNLKGVEVDELNDHMVDGSIVFRAKGHDKNGRHEIAIGSKHIVGLSGKQQDDAIMTASTRALRRLTMQFTTLGILDESEVVAVVGQTVQNNNPVSGAQLSGSPTVMPFALPVVLANNAPGKLVEQSQPSDAAPAGTPLNAPTVVVSSASPQMTAHSQDTRTQVATVIAIAEAEKASTPPAHRTRKKKNTVTLDVEPEVVSKTPVQVAVDITQTSTRVQEARQEPPPQPLREPASAFAAALTQVASDVSKAPVGDIPNETQMAEYRKKIGVFTAQLPSSEGMGSVQKMRAFITRMSGTAPQFMAVKQWEEMLAWFDQFVEKNKVAGLVGYINDVLGVK